jgi:hypothetical protein
MLFVVPPEQLTDEQYDAFLKGEHPIADVGELYGGTSAIGHLSAMRSRNSGPRSSLIFLKTSLGASH